MKILLLFLSSLSLHSIYGQAPLKTSGNCSPIVTGSNNRIVMDGCGLSREEADKIVDLLNQVLAKQDFITINSKLDELLTFSREGPRAWRPTKEQLASLDSYVATHQSGSFAGVNFYSSNQDSTSYANALITVFERHHWPGKNYRYPEGGESGITVSYNAPSPPPGADAMAFFLNSIGITFRAIHTQDLMETPEGKYTITVGFKPQRN